MTGRWRNPGDFYSPAQFHHQEDRWLSRVYTAQVRSVDVASGTLTVATEDGKTLRVVMPLGGMSVQGLNSAWIRFVPQEGDFVEIGYGPDNRPKCLGMCTWGHSVADSEAAQGSDGTGFFRDGYRRLAIEAAKTTPPAGLREFHDLQRGEWDLRSKGGAYIRGGSNGTLLMRGGQTGVTLNANRGEAKHDGELITLGSRGTFLRLGDTKRKLLPTDFNTTPIPQGVPPFKEYDLSVHQELAGGVYNYQYQHRTGSPLDALGVPLLSGLGLPVREQTDVYDGSPNPVPVYTFIVDAGGNVSCSSTLGASESSFVRQSHSATTTFDITGLTGVNINAGGTADQSMVRGEALSLWLTTQLSVQTAFGPSGPALFGLTPAELSALAKVK